MFDLIAIPFGWVMWGIYQIFHNYGLSILLFTVFLKLITLHSTYKMQVNQARMGLLSDKVAKLRKSFANNQQRFQEEQNKLYTEEGVNPNSMLKAIAARRHLLKEKGEPDTKRAADLFLTELRHGKLGRLTLERPDEENSEDEGAEDLHE